MNAVDTNVFVYSVDDNEPTKQTAALELLDQLVTEADTVLLWQVVGEFLGCLRRWNAKGRISRTDVEDHVHDVLAMFPLLVPTPLQVDTSLVLSSRFSLSHWDSMLLAACIDGGIDTLYSEDLSAGATYESVMVRNPFA
ncbi:MAG: PIN domain-containing protein [Planctomycetota bacterium]|jgi:predicted nucleic acid-binding protein